MANEETTIALSSIIVLGILTQWVSSILKIPSILLLLIVGVLTGPMLGFIDPGKVLGNLLIPITSLSMAIILFEGGLSLRLRETKEIGHVIRNIVSLGAAAGFFAIYCFLYYGLNFSATFSLVESAILLISGPTVVIPLLNHLHVKQPVRSILKWEGIMIDPIGALTAVIIYEGLVAGSEHAVAETIVYGIFTSVAIGILLGSLGALFLLYCLRRFWIPDVLHSPMTLMIVLFVFMVSNALYSEAGLLSVTLMALILANQSKTKISHIIDFKENLSLILISFLFITLAGNIDLERIKESAWICTLLVLFLVVVVRPLTVFFSGAFTSLPKNQALFMCFLAPKGIVTGIMASLLGFKLGQIGYADAMYFAPITFGVIVGTVTIYSIFTPLASRLLNVSANEETGVLIIGANLLAREVGKALMNAGADIQLIDANYWKVAETKKSTLPVYRGTFLAFEKENLEKLDQMSLMLAMTENDDVNSLAVIHLQSHFNVSQLFQLPTNTTKIEESLMGQQLFNDQSDYNTLSRLLEDGYIIKTTNLSPEFTFEDWKEKYKNQQAALLFHVQSSGKIVPQTKGSDLIPVSKGKIIFICEKF
jgi:NhaP-type Na+/H+ or K+/H+ antiporter